ncbi:MAG: transposase, partial [Thermoplasmata archaeon]|nr:transposase [Thermoplasmata archaeon]
MSRITIYRMPRMRNQKQRKTSFTITNDEFLIKLIFARMPALINPRSIHIVEVNTFGKAFAKISYPYIKKLLIIVRNEINNLLKEKPLLIADSTGVVVDRMYFQTLNRCRIRKRRFYDKLNVLAEYYPASRIITISDADSLFSSDSFSAKNMLSEIETKAQKFFADAGYDSNDLFEKLLNSKIIPVVKIKKHSGKIRKFRKVAEEMFDEEEYKKYRSVIEGVFGGLENRRLLFTR